MTKKTMKLFETYKEKLNLEFLMYDMNIIDYETCKKNLKDIENRFDTMFINMYSYHVISEKDFNEGFKNIYTFYWEVMEKAIDLYCERKVEEVEEVEELKPEEEIKEETRQNIDSDLEDMTEYYEHNSNYDLEDDLHENGVSWSDFI